jgi:hypothetical protein
MGRFEFWSDHMQGIAGIEGDSKGGPLHAGLVAPIPIK